jgi:hypothetical protein
MADNTLLLNEEKYIEWDWKIEKALRESLSELVCFASILFICADILMADTLTSNMRSICLLVYYHNNFKHAQQFELSTFCDCVITTTAIQ